MGADFTLATFPYFDMTEDRRERFRELIVNLPDSETDEFQEWYGLDDEDYSLEPTEAYDAFNRAAFFDDVYNLAIDFSVEYCKMYA